MITFKELTIRNFLSYGNNTTTIKLDFTSPTLIVGKNHDSIVNGQVDSNGSGKSAILNAIAFCLFDKTISDIEKSDVVNYINAKNMELTLTFIKDGTHYKVERYRKNKAKGGDGVRVFINPDEAVFEAAQDKTPDSVANANRFVESVLGVPFDIFARIVVFTASYEPFLSLPSSHASKANQRDIIEELFGLTELTRKAEKLKELISATKQKMRSLTERNDAIVSERARYQNQLDSTLSKLNDWELSRKEQLREAKATVKRLAKLDLDDISSHLTQLDSLLEGRRLLETTLASLESQLASAVSNNNKLKKWDTDKALSISKLAANVKELEQIDVKYFKEISDKIDELVKQKRTIHKENEVVKSNYVRAKRDIEAKKSEKEELENNLCPYCKQTFNDAKHKIKECQEFLDEAVPAYEQLLNEMDANESAMHTISQELEPLYEIKIPANLDTITTNLVKARTELETISGTENPFTEQDTFAIEAEIMDVRADIDEYDIKIDNVQESLIAVDITQYSKKHTKWSALAVQSIEAEIDNLLNVIDTKSAEANPFEIVAKELKDTLENDIAKEDTDAVDALYKELEHQEFLLKLLTKKDSFVRKALLNKNIPFLNDRLAHYLNAIGLTHKVLFTEDMGVNIKQFGTEYSFKNLSTGQKARVNLALSFAFRDVLQARFSKINFCILDECLDVGLGNVGVQLAARMIKNVAVTDKLSMLVISHRDEIVSMFDSKLEVELKNGFSNIKQSKLSSTVEEE